MYHNYRLCENDVETYILYSACQKQRFKNACLEKFKSILD